MARKQPLTGDEKGRLSITANQLAGKNGGHTQSEQKTQTNRAVSAGAGVKRGDRRDMSPLYTNNKKHAARGNTPRADVSTRKR